MPTNALDTRLSQPHLDENSEPSEPSTSETPPPHTHTKDIHALSDDALATLLKCLTLHDLLSVAETCTRLRKLVRTRDDVWERLCWVDYKRERTSWVMGSYREIYMEHTLMHGTPPATERAARERSRIRDDEPCANLHAWLDAWQ